MSPISISVRVLKQDEPIIEPSISAPAIKPAEAPTHSPQKRETATTNGISVMGTACPIARVARPEYLITKRKISKTAFIAKTISLRVFFFITIHPLSSKPRPDRQKR